MKVPLLLAVPLGVVTLSVPVAPLATAAVMVVALVTVKVAAAVPPKATAVAPVKLAPLMVTTVPAPPLLGVNEVIVGAGTKKKIKVLVAWPPGVVTVIGPVAPLPTVAVMVVSLTTVKAAAGVPPMVTALAVEKPLPEMLTTVPGPPLPGRKEVMAGAEREELKVKAPVLVAVPPGVATVSGPVAPLPTVAVSEVALTTVKDAAAVPPKATAVAPVKLVPVIVTTVPALPLFGVNDVMVGMVGAEVKVKTLLLAAVPPGVVTVSVPVAPLPTVAVIEVALATVKDAANVPSKVTAVAPVKLVPVRVTTVPAPPLLGVNEVMVGVVSVGAGPPMAYRLLSSDPT